MIDWGLLFGLGAVALLFALAYYIQTRLPDQRPRESREALAIPDRVQTSMAEQE